MLPTLTPTNVFYATGTTAGRPIESWWAKIEPLNASVTGIVGRVLFAFAITFVGKYGLHWNWRWIIAVGSLGTMAVDAFVAFLTIADVVRNQWFWTGTSLTENIPLGLRFIVGTYCAVELADPGVEGAAHGLVTTMNNVAGPVSSVIYKYIDSYFKIFSLVFLVMLPPQKKELQELKKKGGQSKLAGTVLVVLFAAMVAFSTVSSVLSIYPSTKCYRIAGGNGQLDPKTGKYPVAAPKM